MSSFPFPKVTGHNSKRNRINRIYQLSASANFQSISTFVVFASRPVRPIYWLKASSADYVPLSAVLRSALSSISIHVAK